MLPIPHYQNRPKWEREREGKGGRERGRDGEGGRENTNAN